MFHWNRRRNPIFAIVMIHFDSEGCGAGFLPEFEKMAKEALRPYQISITMTLFDPFCLILLLGSEKEKRFEEMEPILVETFEELYTGRFDFGLLFIAWKKRQLSERHLIVLSSGKGSGKSSFVAWMGKKCLLR